MWHRCQVSTSVRISISVSGPVPVRDEPVECLPWTRRTGVCRYLPCLEMYVSAADSSWLMPLRDRSGQRWPPSGMPYVVAATEVCSRFIGTCRALSPPSSPFPPHFFLSLLSGVFLEWNTQDLPFLSLVCPWTIVRSWEHLPFSPLPFSPSLFLSFSLSSLHPLPRVSLDAFVIAGSPSFLVCPWTLVS